MKRRELIKGLIASSAIAIVPTQMVFGAETKKPLHIIGLGGGGTNTLEYIHGKGVKAKYTYITFPERALIAQEIEFIDFAALAKIYQRPHGKEVLRQSIYNQRRLVPTEIKKLFNKGGRYALLAGLGGFTGTYFTEDLTKYLYENNFDFISIASIPFEFEGKRRRARVMSALTNLSGIRNIFSFELNDVRHKYGNMLLSEAFSLADKCSYNLISGIDYDIPLNQQLNTLHSRSFI